MKYWPFVKNVLAVTGILGGFLFIVSIITAILLAVTHFIRAFQVP